MAEKQLSSRDSWVRWTVRDCDDVLPYLFRYWAGHRVRLEKLLQGIGLDRCQLTLTLSSRQNRRGWELRAVLRLPTSVLLAHGSDETVLLTLDYALGSLEADLKKHLRQATGAVASSALPQAHPPQPHWSRLLVTAAS
jgi:ribosome-associated translation inhibitor RaiA